MANMANIATNLSTSKGRIMDADFAAETANLGTNPGPPASLNGDAVSGKRLQTEHSSFIQLKS